MWVEQAVFTSKASRLGGGYQVVARSPGIPSETLASFARWSPSHASLQSESQDSESLNYHPLNEEWVAVSRTLHGLKESSGRGGLQVITTALLLRREQLNGYAGHSFRLARIARTAGHLRWLLKYPERLRPIELPDSDGCEEYLTSELCPPPADHLRLVLQMIRMGQRLAIVTKTTQLLEEIVDNLSQRERTTCSFSTALKASKQRPFKLQTFTEISAKTLWRLEADKVHILRLENEAPRRVHRTTA